MNVVYSTANSVVFVNCHLKKNLGRLTVNLQLTLTISWLFKKTGLCRMTFLAPILSDQSVVCSVLTPTSSLDSLVPSKPFPDGNTKKTVLVCHEQTNWTAWWKRSFRSLVRLNWKWLAGQRFFLLQTNNSGDIARTLHQGIVFSTM